MWNNLPEAIVLVPTLQDFEHQLDRLWMAEPFKFNIDSSTPIGRYNYKELTAEVPASGDLQSERVM